MRRHFIKKPSECTYSDDLISELVDTYSECDVETIREFIIDEFNDSKLADAVISEIQRSGLLVCSDSQDVLKNTRYSAALCTM